MRKETLIPLTIISGLVAFELSKYAFSKSTKKEIGERDGWVCQGIDKKTPCVWETIQGKPASYKEGFWMQASHDNHGKHTGYYDEARNGKLRCTCCHYIYDRSLGLYTGAELLITRNEIYHWEARANQEKYPDLDFRLKGVKDVLSLYNEVTKERRSVLVYQSAGAK